MTDFLVRIFVKDSEQTEKEEVRTAYGILASMVGIGCNVLLFIVKLLVGITLNSISVMADAFNNLSDAASSVISFIGVKMASKPADKEHPFGHGRIEYVVALIVAFLIIEVGFTFLKSSVRKIANPEALSFQILLVFFLILSIGVKLWLGLFNKKLGNRINSRVMKAAAADSLGDSFTTLATIISLVVTRYLGIQIDGYVGVIVAVIVMIAGVNIARDTLMPLIGEAVDPEVYKEITDMVESYPGIVGSHDLIVHDYGPTRRMASIHAEVPSDVNIEISHEIIDRIERDVTRKLGIFLVIHMDPIETKNDRLLSLKLMVEEIVNKINPAFTIHDFRMVDGERRVNLIFDLVVPHNCPAEEVEELKETLSEKIKEVDEKYECVITVETGYIAE